MHRKVCTIMPSTKSVFPSHPTLYQEVLYKGYSSVGVVGALTSWLIESGQLACPKCTPLEALGAFCILLGPALLLRSALDRIMILSVRAAKRLCVASLLVFASSSCAAPGPDAGLRCEFDTFSGLTPRVALLAGGWLFSLVSSSPESTEGIG